MKCRCTWEARLGGTARSVIVTPGSARAGEPLLSYKSYFRALLTTSKITQGERQFVATVAEQWHPFSCSFRPLPVVRRSGVHISGTHPWLFRVLWKVNIVFLKVTEKFIRNSACLSASLYCSKKYAKPANSHFTRVNPSQNIFRKKMQSTSIFLS